MKLRIENFAKIKEAEILLDGITVIAGLNDSGKSTVGKVLYSMFNSLNAIDKSVTNKRRQDIRRICDEIVNGVLDDEYYYIDEENDDMISVIDCLTNQILDYEGEITESQYKVLLKNEFLDDDNNIDEYLIDEYAENTYERISKIKNTPKDDLYKEVVERYFSVIFSQQMNNCDSQDSDAKVSITLKSKDICAVFNNNHCVEVEMPVKIMYEAFFIDDPFVLDSINSRRTFLEGFGIRDSLVRRIRSSGKNIMDGIFDAVTSKESLKEVYDVFGRVVDGRIMNTIDGMKYSSESQQEPIAISNMSAGLKGFILIRTLLEKGILKEKDVLILDEPEVHMHTQWQLVYAQIIVLLQKYFDLTILVTTHSSHFLQAIEYYSKLYKINEKCNYYLAQKKEDGVVFESVTDDTSKIHSQMVEPSILLDRLEEELEYENEE